MAFMFCPGMELMGILVVPDGVFTIVDAECNRDIKRFAGEYELYTRVFSGGWIRRHNAYVF